MWKDPIVEETRALRAEYAAKLGNASEKIFIDIQKRQQEAEEKPVSLPPRKPVNRIKPA